MLTTPANITELNYVWSQIQRRCFTLISFLFQIQKPLTLQTVLNYGDSANITNDSKDTEMFCFILTFVRENSFLSQRGGGRGECLNTSDVVYGMFFTFPRCILVPRASVLLLRVVDQNDVSLNLLRSDSYPVAI